MRSSMAKPSARMRPLLPRVVMKAKQARMCKAVKATMAAFDAARALWSSTACVKASVTPGAAVQEGGRGFRLRGSVCRVGWGAPQRGEGAEVGSDLEGLP